MANDRPLKRLGFDRDDSGHMLFRLMCLRMFPFSEKLGTQVLRCDLKLCHSFARMARVSDLEEY